MQTYTTEAKPWNIEYFPRSIRLMFMEQLNQTCIIYESLTVSLSFMRVTVQRHLWGSQSTLSTCVACGLQSWLVVALLNQQTSWRKVSGNPSCFCWCTHSALTNSFFTQQSRQNHDGHIIAYIGCQVQIQDNFWSKLKMKPLEYCVEEKLDDDKVKETYKLEARAKC